MKEKETDQTTTGKPKRRARWHHHVVVTLLAVIIMTLFAIITIKVDYLAPVKSGPSPDSPSRTSITR